MKLGKDGYPLPPKSGKDFKKHWTNIIKDIHDRGNFKESHMQNCIILCQMYCDYDMYQHELGLYSSHFYDTEGGRNGPQIKPRPQVAQLNTLKKDIAQFSKLLGIIPEKDTKSKKSNDDDEWS